MKVSDKTTWSKSVHYILRLTMPTKLKFNIRTVNILVKVDIKKNFKNTNEKLKMAWRSVVW